MSHPSSGTGNTARVGVLGASGYTGGELLRLLASHDGFSVGLLTAERRAGQSLGAVFPHLGGAGFPDLVKIEDAAWDALDAVFCCLPHGTTQEVVAALPGHLKVVDLSADFRLADPEVYAEWYGRAHGAVALQAEAVYGLTELARDDGARRPPRGEPGLLPDRVAAAAGAAARRRADRERGHYHRRQVGGLGRGARGQAGESLRRGRRGRARLRRRPPPPRAGDRARALGGGGDAHSRQLHAPSDSDEPGHSGDDLRPQPRGRRCPARCACPALCGRAVRARPAGGRSTRDPPRTGFEPLPHRGLRRPDRGARHPDLGHRQSGEGRLRPGDPEHEPDARPAGDDRARAGAALP